MKSTVLLCMFLSYFLMVTECQLTALQEHDRKIKQPALNNRIGGREWRAATYQGLTLGLSTRAEMLRVFGEPQYSVPSEAEIQQDMENPEAWYYYKKGGELQGELVVGVDKGSGVIIRLMLRPKNLTREAAIKYFGNDYVITKYDSDDCLGDGESVPLYESPNGTSVFIEYRDRGIAISSNYQGKVNEITYVSKPIGVPVSRCKDQSP